MSATPSPTAVAAAHAALGGAVSPLSAALVALGWPYLSRSAVHARRISGTLPVAPRRIGGRWFVFAVDAAPLFEGDGPSTTEVPTTAAHRGPGRPRKVTHAAAVEIAHG